MQTSQRGLGELAILLIIGGVLVLGGLAYFGLDLGNQESREAAIDAVTPNDNVDDGNNNDDMMLPVPTTTSASGTASSTVRSESDVAFTLRLQNLSVEQRAFLRLKGIDGDEIQVTNGMVTCAEAKLGRDRVVAIRNGASLSMSEQIQLLACYD